MPVEQQVRERANRIKTAPKYQPGQAVKEKEDLYKSKFNIGDGIFFFMCLLFIITVTSAVAKLLL